MQESEQIKYLLQGVTLQYIANILGYNIGTLQMLDRDSLHNRLPYSGKIWQALNFGELVFERYWRFYILAKQIWVWLNRGSFPVLHGER